MSTDEVGFLTGIFRQGALDQYGTPTYYLKNKANVQFPNEISDNTDVQVWLGPALPRPPKERRSPAPW